MSSKKYTPLANRCAFFIKGADARPFLQGLITNDIEKVTDKEAIFAAFLTPQGKFLYDLFVSLAPVGFLLECEAANRDDFIKKLKLYKLRSDVSFELADDLKVFALWGAEALSGVATGNGIYQDPRHTRSGYRAVVSNVTALEAAEFQPADFEDYDQHRIELGLPDGTRDLIQGQAILLENNFDVLNAIDWDKGCYLGQELTARTKYRGLVRKRLFPVKIDGTPPEFDAPLMYGETQAGHMRSHAGQTGLALLRLEQMQLSLQENKPFVQGNCKLWPQPLDYIPML